MCQYNLEICPHPHRDPIAAAVLDISKDESWVQCDLRRPWGRLSCGNLSIHHPRLISRRSSSLFENTPSNVHDIVETIHIHTTNPFSLIATKPANRTPVLPVIRTRLNSDEISAASDASNPSSHNQSSSSPTSLATTFCTHTTSPDPSDATQVTVDSAELNFTMKCEWCTATLKAVAYKSKEVQREAEKTLAALEEVVEGDAAVRNMRKEIAQREEELEVLRFRAWSRATTLCGKGKEK